MDDEPLKVEFIPTFIVALGYVGVFVNPRIELSGTGPIFSVFCSPPPLLQQFKTRIPLLQQFKTRIPHEVTSNTKRPVTECARRVAPCGGGSQTFILYINPNIYIIIS
jgi:hypothetical protein